MTRSSSGRPLWLSKARCTQMTTGIGGGVVVVSLVIEALRPRPRSPEVGGSRLRYIRSGRGPTLVLLHTLRTQLDLFEKVIPQLARDFAVFAFDYPGHRYSDIPDAKYDAEFFAGAVAGFLDTLGLRDVTLAGVSIGASTALMVAARSNHGYLG